MLSRSEPNTADDAFVTKTFHCNLTLSFLPLTENDMYESVNLPSVFTDLLYHTLSFRSAGHSTAQAAVCAECHCMTDQWHTMQ